MRKGITEILIYSSVIEIKQINVFFFAIIITELAARSDLRGVLYARVSSDYCRFSKNGFDPGWGIFTLF